MYHWDTFHDVSASVKGKDQFHGFKTMVFISVLSVLSKIVKTDASQDDWNVIREDQYNLIMSITNLSEDLTREKKL